MGYWGILNATLAKGNLKMEVVNMTAAIGEGLTLKKTINGQGTLYFIHFLEGVFNESEQVSVYVHLDDEQIIPYYCPFLWNTYGYDTASKPFELSKYTVDGANVGAYVFQWGLRFNKSIKFYTYCAAVTVPTVIDAYVYYDEATI